MGVNVLMSISICGSLDDDVAVGMVMVVIALDCVYEEDEEVELEDDWQYLLFLLLV